MFFYLQNDCNLEKTKTSKSRVDDAAVQQRGWYWTKPSVAAQENAVIEFESREYKHDVEFIWSESKNIKVCCLLCAADKTTIVEIAAFALHLQ